MADDETAFYVALGAEIKRRRGRMTQAQLAEAIDLPRTSVILIERGDQRVHAYTLVRLAQVLGTTVEELLPISTGQPIHVDADTTPSAVREWIASIASTPVLTTGGSHGGDQAKSNQGARRAAARDRRGG